MMYVINVAQPRSRRVIDPATYQMITMTKERVLTVEEFDERDDWCTENCKEEFEWIGGMVERGFKYTFYKSICFKNEYDAMAFKLRWT